MEAAMDNPDQPIPSSSSSPNKNFNSNALSQLSSQLISSGFLRRPLPPNTFNGGSIEGQELLLKSIWSLLGSRSKEIAVRESLMAKQREILYEHSRVEGFLSRCEKQKLEAEQESTANKNRANTIQNELESERAKHRKTREELNKLKNSEKLIKVTTMQEMRRKSNELNELQRRLAKLADSKDIVFPSKLILNSQGVLIGSRVETDGGGRIGLLEFDLQTSRKLCEELQSENRQLRTYLDLYETQVLNVLSEIDDAYKNSVVDELDKSDETNKTRYIATSNSNSLSRIYTRMSLVTYRLRDKVFELTESIENSKFKVKEIENLHEEEKLKIQSEYLRQRQNLESDIERLKKSLAEAEKVIEGWAQAGFSDTKFLEEPESHEAEKSMEIGQSLKIQAEVLSAERKKFTEEAIALGKQRAELELRKLDEERRKILEEIEMDEPLPPRVDAPTTSETVNPETSTTEKTLESLVVYTKPSSSSTMKKPEVRDGKAKSSYSRGLSNVQNIKNKPVAPAGISRPGTRERAAALKSLLSVTGEETKAEGSSSGNVLRSSPRLKTSRTAIPSSKARGRSTLSRGSGRLNNVRGRSNLSSSTRQTFK